MRSLLFVLPLLATACGDANPVSNVVDPQARAEKRAARDAAADSKAVKAGFAPAAEAPLEMPRIDPVAVKTPGSYLPPSSDQYRYIGAWAASPALCATQAWRFETRKLKTPFDVDCSYPEVGNVPGGYTLTGSCKGKGGKVDQVVTVRFDEAKRSIRVEGKSLGPVDLIYCGA